MSTKTCKFWFGGYVFFFVRPCLKISVNINNDEGIFPKKWNSFRYQSKHQTCYMKEIKDANWWVIKQIINLEFKMSSKCNGP